MNLEETWRPRLAEFAVPRVAKAIRRRTAHRTSQRQLGEHRSWFTASQTSKNPSWTEMTTLCKSTSQLGHMPTRCLNEIVPGSVVTALTCETLSGHCVGAIAAELITAHPGARLQQHSIPEVSDSDNSKSN